MQVKKFEARTMKEALEMVKVQLGPDAIILSAKDNSKKFGLVGQGSVEITAAVSDEKLQQKKYAESKIRPQDRERFNKGSVKTQRQFIDQAVNGYLAENRPRPPMTQTRYAEIQDDGLGTVSNGADLRIKSAVERAWNAMQVHGEWVEQEPEAPSKSKAPPSKAPKSAPVQTPQQLIDSGVVPNIAVANNSAANRTAVMPANQNPMARVQDLKEIQDLKSQVATLKKAIEGFQNVPQTWSSTYPGAQYRLPFELSSSFERLTSAGVAEDIAAELLGEAQEQMSPIRIRNRALVNGFLAKRILETTLVTNSSASSLEGFGSKVQIFMGPKGSGKTSSLVKLASQLVVNHKKRVLIASTDTLKVGAIEQLRIYSQILNVPFVAIRNADEWQRLMTQIGHFDFILCDMPGMGLRDEKEFFEIRSLLPPSQHEIDSHLVLSITAKDSDLTEIGKNYQQVGFADVLFTGLDESAQHGSIYNFCRHFDRPLHSFGIGSRIPEDFEWATKERVLDLIFKLSRMAK